MLGTAEAGRSESSSQPFRRQVSVVDARQSVADSGKNAIKMLGADSNGFNAVAELLGPLPEQPDRVADGERAVLDLFEFPVGQDDPGRLDWLGFAAFRLRDFLRHRRIRLTRPLVGWSGLNGLGCRKLDRFGEWRTLAGHAHLHWARWAGLPPSVPTTRQVCPTGFQTARWPLPASRSARRSAWP